MIRYLLSLDAVVPVAGQLQRLLAGEEGGLRLGWDQQQRGEEDSQGEQQHDDSLCLSLNH